LELFALTTRTTTRRELLALIAAGAAAGAYRSNAWAQRPLPARTIPSTGEPLPIIGLGSTRPVSEIAEHGPERVEGVVRALVEHGGKVVDTWPRNEDNDVAFGRIIDAPDLRGRLFVTVNLEQTEQQAGIDQLERALRAYRRDSIDLVNVGSLAGLDVQWPSLKNLKEAGRARYIGVTAARAELYDQLETFLRTETPDFVEINYSVTERGAEQRFLPMLADRGIATLISRPFMNGAYFERLANAPVPDWAAEFECESWADFSLQYILANPAVTCVLTETTNAAHMAENALCALKPVPDAAARQRMRQVIDAA
jgi:diketogulonate reductase-like aldo/keto reductase